MSQWVIWAVLGVAFFVPSVLLRQATLSAVVRQPCRESVSVGHGVPMGGSSGTTLTLTRPPVHTFLSSSTVKEIASLNGNVSSMVPPHVDHALKEKVAQLGEQSLPNALRD